MAAGREGGRDRWTEEGGSKCKRDVGKERRERGRERVKERGREGEDSVKCGRTESSVSTLIPSLTFAQRSLNLKNAAWPAALGTTSFRPNTVNCFLDGTGEDKDETRTSSSCICT